MRRRRGFTLIELMVAMALAGLVVGGALQLHASFNKQTERQNQVAEMQQNLRVSMLIIERAIRSAGWGIPGGMLPEYGGGAGCALTGAHAHYGFEWSNTNTYSDPITVVTMAAKPSSATDTDPDYFWVASADSSTLPVYAISDAANVLTMQAGTTTAQMANFNDHDLFSIALPDKSNSSFTCPSAPGGTSNCFYYVQPPRPVPAVTPSNDTTYGHCIREISTGSSHGGAGTTKTLLHNSASSNYCFNWTTTLPQSGGDPCTTNINTVQPVAIRRIPAMLTAYRVMGPEATFNIGGTPKLTRRTAAIGTAYTAAPWTVIAENIDDMQLAVISNTGVVCNQVNDPTQAGCDIMSAAAVRVTLSARSASKIAGITTDTFPLTEDRSVSGSAATDIGYLHRALTAEIELRNMGSNQ